MAEGKNDRERPESWIVDFLNILLGKSPETDEFWREHLLPRASQHFNFPISDLEQYKINANSLYFGFPNRACIYKVEEEIVPTDP